MAAARFEPMARGQPERLVPMIEEVMAEAGLAYDALDAIAVTRGPGGFTGVRIGLATARGLALASGRPVIGLTSFEAVAAAARSRRRGAAGSLAVLIDAKRRDLYLQVFDAALPPLAAPRPWIPRPRGRGPAGRPLLLAGDGLARAHRPDGRRAASASDARGHAEAARLPPFAAARCPSRRPAAPPPQVALSPGAGRHPARTPRRPRVAAG